MPIFGFKDTGFEIETESLGTLNFHRVSPDYAARIEKADFQHDLPPDAFLSLLMVILGRKQEDRAILVEEAYGLSAAEREAFVHAFLNEHGEYYRERISEERTSETGEKVVRSYLGDRIVNPRHIGEEPAVYLTRIYRDFAAGIVTPEVRTIEIVEPAHPVAEEHSDIFADNLLKNAALSESLGKSLAQMKMLESRDEERASAPARAASAPVDPADDARVVEEPPASVEPPPPPFVRPPLPPLPSLSFSDVSPPAREVGPPEDAFVLRLDEPEKVGAAARSPNEALAVMRDLHDSVLRRLEGFTEEAQQNARGARTARRIAILALILALILPALPLGYMTWKDGLWGREFNRTLTEQTAQAAEQKRQIDSLVDQLRAQRTQPSARVAD